MGFWSKVGKFAGKTALGIIAPGALAGYEYQKAKETNEILKGFDEAIEMLFKSLAQLKEGDSWSELLVRARSLVVKILSDEDAREPILKEIHPNEQGRAICLIMTSALANPEVVRVLSPSEDDRTFLAGVLGIIEAHCQQLDAKIAGRGLATMEESVLRMLYDYVCTRMAHVEISCSLTGTMTRRRLLTHKCLI